MISVLGRDAGAGEYRLSVDGVVARLPESMIAEVPLTGGSGHATAYDWIARHGARIEDAIAKKKSGRGGVAPPFDRLIIEEDG